MQNQKKTFVTSNIFRCESVKMIDVTQNSDERDPCRALVATRFQITRTHIIEVSIKSAAIISSLPKHKAKDQDQE